MAVIGIDSHKDTLAGCLIDEAGTPIEHRELPNTAAGHAELVAWASAAGVQRVGIEGRATSAAPRLRRSSRLGSRWQRCPRR